MRQTAQKNLRFVFLALACLLYSNLSQAHRLDECLQATLVAIEPTHLEISIRLLPGAAVSQSIISTIDTNHDGIISQSEQNEFIATSVVSDLSIQVNGTSLHPQLITESFPSLEQLRAGTGEIQLEFRVALPERLAPNRLVTIEHRHPLQSAVFLVNALVPNDPTIHITHQKRNESQSVYELSYTQSSFPATPSMRDVPGRVDRNTFAHFFKLGMHHIQEGTDHLLFLLVVLLVAPLVVVGGRWSRRCELNRSVIHILKIVTAFTVGHSITLALSSFAKISAPAQWVEIFIALSILIAAIHALRPIFPGKEGRVALFFGLIHGLAFASALSDLGLPAWDRVSALLAFNLGIEAMQLVVIVLIIPSFLIMSATPMYRYLRIGGATFGIAASLAWIIERVFEVRTPVDWISDTISANGLWVAAILFVASLASMKLKGNQT